MSLSRVGRIVEINGDERALSKNLGFLVVRSADEVVGQVPLDDIAAVIATSRDVIVSSALLSDLATRGIVFVVCGANYTPVGILWPIDGHHAQQRRMECQLAAKPEMNKKIWALLVAAKISAQAWALRKNVGVDGGLPRLAASVTLGDAENREAQAARRYWSLMFGGSFRRDPAAEGVNALLNYGYTILRSATARAVTAAGLHPSVGIFHRHPRNAMPLVDDLMEPFRPIVDLEVAEIIKTHEETVSPNVKRRLVDVLGRPTWSSPSSTPLSIVLHRLASSLAESYAAGKVDERMTLFLVPTSAAR